MSYKEIEEQEFYYFTSEERDLIHKKLEELGYRHDYNTVCGDCCGMFAEYIYVGRIGGKWKPEHQKEMISFLKEKGIEASVDVDHKYSDGSGNHYAYIISADPNEYEKEV